MSGRKHKHFVISGDAMLELIKERFNLPEDATLVKMMIDPPTPELIDLANNARFLIESDSFSVVHEGALTPRLSKIEKYEVGPAGNISLIEWKD